MTGAIKALPTLPTSRLLVEGLKTPKSNQFNNWVPPFHPHGVRYSEPRWGFRVSLVANTSSAGVSSEFDSGAFPHSQDKIEHIETNLEKVIYGCRFFAILAVWGSLLGSFLCFIKGCGYVVASFQEYFVNRGKVIFSLVEALEAIVLIHSNVYLLGTVMLVFGMGLYELFISNLDKAKSISDDKVTYTSNFFGLFTLKDRPQWLGIKSVDELKTKLGHVIVMLLLIGFFDKTRKATILSSLDLLCFAASVLLSSGCLYLLSKLHSGE